MTDQIPATVAAQVAFAAGLLAQQGQGDALTPLTVLVHSADGEGTHYAVTGLHYDRDRREYVLTLDEDAPAPGACQFDFSHTRQWCGNPRCRAS